MDAYLSKPIDEEQLYKLLVKWISDRPEKMVIETDPRPSEPTKGRSTLDAEGAIMRLGGRRHLFTRVLKKFAPECENASRSILQYLAAGERESASRIAHTVKGAAAAIGALDLSSFAAELEQALLDGDHDLDGMLDVFNEKLAQASTAARAFLDSEEI